MLDKPFEVKDWEVSVESGKAFDQECRAAVDCPSVFSKFRQLPGVLRVVENETNKSAYLAWLSLRRACPSLLEKADLIAVNDSVGGPRVIAVDEINHHLSAVTMCFAADYAALLWCFGSLDRMNIAEIGGGYGGLASLITRLSRVESYTIFDLPNVNALQKKYLDCLKCERVQYTSQVSSTPKNYDLVISCAALSELSEPLREMYAAHLLYKSDRGWIIWGPRVQEGQKMPWHSQRVTDWLSKELSPKLVHCGRDLIEYREIFRDRAVITHMWGGPMAYLANQPWKAREERKQ